MATVIPGVENSLERSLELPSDPPDGADRLLVPAAESRHKEIELTADELLQYLDTKSERRRKR